MEGISDIMIALSMQIKTLESLESKNFYYY